MFFFEIVFWECSNKHNTTTTTTLLLFFFFFFYYHKNYFFFTMADGRVKERNVLEGALKKGKTDEVSLSIFAFLFSEFVQYTQGKVKTHAEWEERLSNAGRNGLYILLLMLLLLLLCCWLWWWWVVVVCC